eukprot:4685030-Amphidinium_carterae.3
MPMPHQQGDAMRNSDSAASYCQLQQSGLTQEQLYRHNLCTFCTNAISRQQESAQRQLATTCAHECFSILSRLNEAAGKLKLEVDVRCCGCMTNQALVLEAAAACLEDIRQNCNIVIDCPCCPHQISRSRSFT